MKISAVIPVYNQGSTIKATVEAALHQVQPFHEVVVCDNYSTDATPQVLAGFGSRIKVVTPPGHLAMSANWNYAVRQSSGDWVAMCSGDDLLLPNYVEAVSAAVRETPDAVFVMGGWQIRNETKGTITPRVLLSMGRVTRPPKTVEMELVGCKACFAAFCFRRDAFNRIGGFDEEYVLIADWVMQIALGMHGPFLRLDDIVAEYRVTDRPVLEQSRVPIYVSDRLRFFTETLWTAEKIGVPASRIIKSGRFHLRQFYDFLAINKAKLSDDDEARLVSISERLGRAEWFERWMRGRWVPSRPLYHYIVTNPAIRNIYRHVRSLLPL